MYMKFIIVGKNIEVTPGLKSAVEGHHLAEVGGLLVADLNPVSGRETEGVGGVVGVIPRQNDLVLCDRRGIHKKTRHTLTPFRLCLRQKTRLDRLVACKIGRSRSN